MLWSYDLPPDRIAKYPLPQRHDARLLIYRGGHIQETIFLHLAEHLPPGTRLFYNDTKVIPARLRQGKFELLLTELTEGKWDEGPPQVWKALFRPGRFWRRGGELTWESAPLTFKVRWLNDADERQGYFSAEWHPPHYSALDVLQAFGTPPLPPYLKREAEPEDSARYQTIYAHKPGSVAAPTAGLHFTPEVWKSLAQRGIQTYPLTLHVGIGTFLPLKTPDAPEKHPMHAERFAISKETLSALRKLDGPVLCVGTTTLRLIESLYWLGLSYAKGEKSPSIVPLIWQQTPVDVSPKEALAALPDELHGITSLYLLPGYPFQIADALITNFHMPDSTLLALVQAFIGEKAIQAVYEYALKNGFRFLSYGDTSLLWRH
ncbi:MAG: S-adenosylmethionine:tRNA ribosyltransferase-isomerase [Bacteroidia bacterium]|nr:S-adenosylmethionine:tRNA ribosyltransferase-isomerase [Bacteroidia bacterium]MCX7651726.1 S-adenosylmethionine:tRNA ribosyltransferase-isomerase [Bacteroidia bacterium]MDW8417671.1 S-adenosylmethionine:tRNA ribosyltransferase-isomerase [Bacteroidia bacterium]